MNQSDRALVETFLDKKEVFKTAEHYISEMSGSAWTAESTEEQREGLKAAPMIALAMQSADSLAIMLKVKHLGKSEKGFKFFKENAIKGALGMFALLEIERRGVEEGILTPREGAPVPEGATLH